MKCRNSSIPERHQSPCLSEQQQQQKKTNNKNDGSHSLSHSCVRHFSPTYFEPHHKVQARYSCLQSFPGGSGGKESACNAGDLGLIPGLEEPLEKGMATHSRIFAWRIPWTEEPAGLQSVGSQRVGCNFIHLIQL